MKEKKKQYGEPVRIRSKTVDLIHRIDPEEKPFNTKLYNIVRNYAISIGVIAEK